MPVQPLALHHVTVLVTDVEKSADFYTRLLGMARFPGRPSHLGPGAWLAAGNQQLHLSLGTPPVAGGQHFALQVADLEAASDELRSEGVKVSAPVTIGSARQAFLSDPDGNAIELHEAATAG